IAFAGVVRRFLADGTPSWTRTMPGGAVTEQAVAIDAAGVVYGTSDAVDQLTLEPTSAAGAALPAMEAYCDEYRGGPVIDPATGAVWCVTSGHGDVVWRRAPDSFVERPTSAAGSVSVGLTGTGTGDAGWAYENDEGPDNRWHLVRMTGTTVAWQHVFPVVSSFPSPLFPTYSKPTAITGGATGRLAAAGSIEGFGALRGFVISFAP
ncbi:MAG TPA: hypothetical protein VFD53_05285, partial [Ilumatobacter sp.]|nr:hypothetical protein [Ilumatobacter sp.]